MNRTSVVVICLVSAALLAGCTSPRTKVVDELRQFGVAKPVAKCMGRELDDRLRSRAMKNLARFLERANEGRDARPGHVLPGQVLDVIGNMNNPHILEAAMKSGLSCTVLR